MAARVPAGRGRLVADTADPGALSTPTASASVETGKTSRPPTTVASAAFGAGTSRPRTPARRAAAAIGSTPA